MVFASALPRMMSFPSLPVTFSISVSVSEPCPDAVPASRSTTTRLDASSKVAVSLPVPPSRTSLPSPPESRSSPAPPKSSSSPAFPNRLSSPSIAAARSSPLMPLKVSFPSVAPSSASPESASTQVPERSIRSSSVSGRVRIRRLRPLLLLSGFAMRHLRYSSCLMSFSAWIPSQLTQISSKRKDRLKLSSRGPSVIT